MDPDPGNYCALDTNDTDDTEWDTSLSLGDDAAKFSTDDENRR